MPNTDDEKMKAHTKQTHTHNRFKYVHTVYKCIKDLSVFF